MLEREFFPCETDVGVSVRSRLRRLPCVQRAIPPTRARVLSPPRETSRSPRGRLPRMTDVTRILSAIEQGDPHAAGQLLPLVYEELRNLAAQKPAQEMPGQTLQSTALVHEAYLRLVNVTQGQHWNSRGHFFAAAAEAMQRILIETARRKHSPKHGGGWTRKGLDEVDLAAPDSPDELLALDEALERLAQQDKDAADVVRLRLYAGLPLAEAAELLGISPRPADRLWAYARAWLHEEIWGDGPKGSDS